MKENKRKYSHKIRQKRLSRSTYNQFDIFANEYHFYVGLLGLVMLAFFITPYPKAAMWFGFIVSSYAVIANDSIQTLGVFITSNKHRAHWWLMWGFIAAIFVVTVWVSWIWYDGDVSYQRLANKGLATSPASIGFVHLFAPILLLLLTRLRMPVSTTFFLLSTFTTEVDLVWCMTLKSLVAYIVAFVLALCAWFVFCSFKIKLHKASHIGWVILQWLSSGFLWSTWLMQDGANIAIFFPRSLDLITFVGFVIFVCILLGVLFYMRGSAIQVLVNNKTDITDIRSACGINIFYMLLLFCFTIFSKIPMSTTWMFIGVLGGRELANILYKRYKGRRHNLNKCWMVIFRDLKYAILGLISSILLTCMMNPLINYRFGELYNALLQ